MMDYILRTRACGLASAIHHSLSSACCFEIADHTRLKDQSDAAAIDDLHKLAALLGFDLVRRETIEHREAA